ncbi:hypothetical protein [Mycobacterium kubicae]
MLAHERAHLTGRHSLRDVALNVAFRAMAIPRALGR